VITQAPNSENGPCMALWNRSLHFLNFLNLSNFLKNFFVFVHPRQVRRFAPDADVHALETSSGRSALHKAAYWGHEQLTAVLLKEFAISVLLPITQLVHGCVSAGTNWTPTCRTTTAIPLCMMLPGNVQDLFFEFQLSLLS
jgi:hypothetical protein